jgi:hypothetical protein
MHAIDVVAKRIRERRPLLIAGDERLLGQLPTGNWIGGSTPDLLATSGTPSDPRLLHVTELPGCVTNVSVRTYDRDTIPSVYTDTRASDFSIMVVPAASPTHLEFALRGPSYRDFAIRPLVGWVSGLRSDDLGRAKPKVFSGPTGTQLEDGAAVMHATLPPTLAADVGVLNLFEQGDGDTIRFPEDGFSAREVMINGTSANLAEYISTNGLDIRLPLVADYYGAMVNVSFLSVETVRQEVRFYAPVFAGVSYKHAKPISGYRQQFISRMPTHLSHDIAFSCNCILNYQHSGLSWDYAGEIPGFMTFGEVAYQLLNQTMVYLTINSLPAETR